MKPGLCLHRILVRRKRVLLDYDPVAPGGRPVEGNHHEMQIHRERVHGDDFQRLSAHQPRGLFGQQLVVLHPRMPRAEMAVHAQQFPVFQLLLDRSAHALGLQAKRMPAKIGAFAPIGPPWNVEAVPVIQGHPRPANGMLVAITVINCTLASSGRFAIYRTASATCRTSITGSGFRDPSACGTPDAMRAVMSVAALPMSICPQAISYLRPSSEMHLVSPVMACLVAVYGAELGPGTWAEIEPLLTIRPPRGVCAFMILMASCAHKNGPVRLTLTTALHCSQLRCSIGMPGAPMPALLKSRSSRPKASFTLANRAFTASGLPTSVGTASISPPPARAMAAVPSSSATRRPASTTEYPAPCKATLTARPMPLPAPVTSAILLSPMFYPSPVQRGLLRGQQQKEHAVVRRVHHRSSLGRSGALAHPAERRPCR